MYKCVSKPVAELKIAERRAVVLSKKFLFEKKLKLFIRRI